MSGSLVLEKLQGRFSCDLTSRQRRLLKLPIIERLKKQPAPLTVARSNDCGVVTGIAAITVLNVPELLESILSHLPMKDLFITGRVNKTFYRLIVTSPTLQRQLFLLPGKGQPKWQLLQSSIDGQKYASVASSSDDASAFPSTNITKLGNPRSIVRINPLLELRRGSENKDMHIDKAMESRGILDSAYLDERICESKAWPNMYLTDPPCTCVHIDVDYADTSLIGCPVLRARRCVYDPAGVTFGAIYETLHEKGPIAVYERRKFVWNDYELYIEHNTTMREQVELQEKEFYRPCHISFTDGLSIVEFCNLTLPTEAEFEEMSRTGRVVGSRPPEPGESELSTPA